MSSQIIFLINGIRSNVSHNLIIIVCLADILMCIHLTCLYVQFVKHESYSISEITSQRPDTPTHSCIS